MSFFAPVSIYIYIYIVQYSTVPNPLKNQIQLIILPNQIFLECITDSDCPDHLACGEDKECVDPPCPECSANADCKGSNHIGICICNPGYVGDPYLEGCQGVGKQRQSHNFNVVRVFDFISLPNSNIFV